MNVEEPRVALARIAAERGVSLSRLSRLIGRNPAYVQQHVARGSPRLLNERDRELIAAFLGVEEWVLGGRRPGVAPVARYDLAASAGPGGFAEIEWPAKAASLPLDLLDGLGVRAELASMIRVGGDSMSPTLMTGDDILVDAGRRKPGADGGIYVLRLDDVLMVKRVRPDRNTLVVTSDNPAMPSPGRVDPDRVAVIGRVMWVSRRL